ncbi:MAG: PHP domain-containing protein [Ruminococcus sp.]
MIDLHIHTTCSDGQFTPEETMRLAAEAGVTVAAVTDHDTVSGISRARQTAQQLGMTFFSGIEISVQYTRELHILGYGIDADSAAAGVLRGKRQEPAGAHITDAGISAPAWCVISLEDVRRCNQGRTSGRPHFARALVELGYAGSIQDAFEKYLATPAFYAEAERPKPSPEKGIAVIRQAGGVAVLAHPHQLKLEGPELEALLQQLISLGLQGIEAHYSRHTAEQTRLYLQLAEKYGLLVTSGSDFHGPSVKPDIQLGSGVAGSLCVEDGEIPRRLEQAIAANSALA